MTLRRYTARWSTPLSRSSTKRCCCSGTNAPKASRCADCTHTIWKVREIKARNEQGRHSERSTSIGPLLPQPSASSVSSRLVATRELPTSLKVVVKLKRLLNEQVATRAGSAHEISVCRAAFIRELQHSLGSIGTAAAFQATACASG